MTEARLRAWETVPPSVPDNSGVPIDTEPGWRGMGVHLTGARLAEATPTHGLSVRLGEERNCPPLRHGPPDEPPPSRPAGPSVTMCG
jgi:hypothetical protein